ncbi:MAG: VOC family protein [Galactobacter sp.]
MATTIQVTFDCHDPALLARFWAQALGYVLPPPPGTESKPDGDPLDLWDAFLDALGIPLEERNNSCAAEDPDGVGPRLYFQKVPEDKIVKNRLHLDVRAAPGKRGDKRMAALELEAQRLIALGASVFKRVPPEPPLEEEGLIIMQDPEGNEFCLD